MTLETELTARSNARCELCRSEDPLAPFEVPPHTDGGAENYVMICEPCKGGVSNSKLDATNHWNCLGESMWSDEAVVQVMAWRILNRLRAQSWAQDLLDMLYLDEETQVWASLDSQTDDTTVVHNDSNGVVLEAGDTVALIKDLVVKGAGFTAKRGTAVRAISLVPDNPKHIEGRVNGQQIVILTEFVKKTS